MLQKRNSTLRRHSEPGPFRLKFGMDRAFDFADDLAQLAQSMERPIDDILKAYAMSPVAPSNFQAVGVCQNVECGPIAGGDRRFDRWRSFPMLARECDRP